MRILLISLSLLILVCQAALAQSTCNPTTCKLPDCHCADTAPPNGLAPSESPQFVILTFDDAITSFSESFASPIFHDVTNPDGQPVRVTYFTNALNSQPDIIKALYDAGHEMANHTATHGTGNVTDYETWVNEIEALKAFLTDEVGLPADQVAGFRAPFLATNETMWQALHDTGMLYDSSIPEQLPGPISTGLDSWVWPHTLDHGLRLACTANHCPEQTLSGLWNIPMWVMYTEQGIINPAMDPAAGFNDAFADLLEHNFTMRYTGNRAPLGIYLHAGQMWDPGRQKVLHDFLQTQLMQDDVWMITMRGLIEWMRDPVPNSQMADWFARGCDRGCTSTPTPTETLAPDELNVSVYPNPTAHNATLVAEGLVPSTVYVELFDVLGRKVHQNEFWQSGRTSVVLPLRDVPAGVYIYRLRTQTTVLARNLVVRQ